MKPAAADPTIQLQRTRQELRSILANNTSAHYSNQFPRSATLRLLVGGISNRLVWGAAGNVLSKAANVVGAVSRVVPLSTLGKLLLGRSRR